MNSFSNFPGNFAGNFPAASDVKRVTIYDLLKTVLVVLMIIDHVGYFFLPEYPTLRAIGRWCAPAWFFLVGYGAYKSGPATKPDWPLWAAATVVALGHGFMMNDFLPINILFSIALARLLVRHWEARWNAALIPIFFVLAALTVIAYDVIEYGMFALLFALWGRLAKHAARGAAVKIWAAAVTAFFIAQQWYEFNFDITHGVIMAAGVLAMAGVLWRFEPKPMRAGLMAPVLRFCGRQTLLIYVVHFLTFALIATAIAQG